MTCDCDVDFQSFSGVRVSFQKDPQTHIFKKKNTSSLIAISPSRIATALLHIHLSPFESCVGRSVSVVVVVVFVHKHPKQHEEQQPEKIDNSACLLENIEKGLTAASLVGLHIVVSGGVLFVFTFWSRLK
jgi:hypothetical protein